VEEDRAEAAVAAGVADHALAVGGVVGVGLPRAAVAGIDAPVLVRVLGAVSDAVSVGVSDDRAGRGLRAGVEDDARAARRVGIGRDSHLETVGKPVAIGVRVEGARRWPARGGIQLLAVGEPVAVGIHAQWVGAVDPHLGAVGEAVAVGVGVVGIGSVDRLVAVG